MKVGVLGVVNSKLTELVLAENLSGTNAQRYHLTTIIRWDDVNQIEKELSFYVIQMVF